MHSSFGEHLKQLVSVHSRPQRPLYHKLSSFKGMDEDSAVKIKIHIVMGANGIAA